MKEHGGLNASHRQLLPLFPGAVGTGALEDGPCQPHSWLRKLRLREAWVISGGCRARQGREGPKHALIRQPRTPSPLTHHNLQ